MNISRQTLLDIAHTEVLSFLKKLQRETDLSVYDLENVLYRVIVDIKTEKEVKYSDTILTLTSKVHDLEEEKKKMAQEQVVASK